MFYDMLLITLLLRFAFCLEDASQLMQRCAFLQQLSAKFQDAAEYYIL